MYDERILAEAEARWWMLCYKVQPCLEPCPHDWVTCPQQHPNEKAARRCPRAARYVAARCPQRNKKAPNGGDCRSACSKSDACGYAHTVYELWLHPDRFRTQMCLHGSACIKPLCFFAHSAAELRTPATQLAAALGAAPAPPAAPSGPNAAKPPPQPCEAAAAADAAAAAVGLDVTRDPAEVLMELHAELGGGRFSLAAALAEVQVRQRRLYGPAARGPAPPRALGGLPAAALLGAPGCGGAGEVQVRQQLLGADAPFGAQAAPLGGFLAADLAAGWPGEAPLARPLGAAAAPAAPAYDNLLARAASGTGSAAPSARASLSSGSSGPLLFDAPTAASAPPSLASAASDNGAGGAASRPPSGSGSPLFAAAAARRSAGACLVSSPGAAPALGAAAGWEAAQQQQQQLQLRRQVEMLRAQNEQQALLLRLLELHCRGGGAGGLAGGACGEAARLLAAQGLHGGM